MILIKIAIAGLIVFWAYWLIDCLMSGKKQKPVAKQKAKPDAKLIEKSVEGLTWEQLNENRSIKILGQDVKVKKGTGIY